MTLEAELLGSEIDKGSLTCEAKITKEAFPSVQSAIVPKLKRLPAGGRAERVISAIERTAARRPDEPLFGSLTGPVSTAASIVDPIAFLKALRKDRENCHRVLSDVTDTIFLLASAMVEAGAEVIAISDPTATGEILGPKAFDDFALRHINALIDRIHALQVKVIVHICGDVAPVEHLVAQLHSDAISTDAQVSLTRIKGLYPHLTTMGNVSTSILQFGSPERITQRTRRLVTDGVDIIAPACGLGTTTPLANVQAMTAAVKEN
jgi:[methyl-Co(III) methanol-specific corrinoid protein]:coenzyme M methyltransferase